jgi:hypothetical protein
MVSLHFYPLSIPNTESHLQTHVVNDGRLVLLVLRQCVALIDSD